MGGTRSLQYSKSFACSDQVLPVAVKIGFLRKTRHCNGLSELYWTMRSFNYIRIQG